MHVKHLKITFVSIITFVATALLFAGCSKEETPHLELSTTEMTLFNLGEAATFDINSSSALTISYDTDFLQVTPNSGKGGATTTVTVELTEENNTGADRQSSISVKAGQLAESVTVTSSPAGRPKPVSSLWQETASSAMTAAEIVNSLAFILSDI